MAGGKLSQLKRILRAAGGQVQAGALVNASSSTGKQPGATALHIGALHGQPRAVRLLLAHGARVNAVETKGIGTPLHLAAHKGHIATIEYLIVKNADVGLKNRAQRTPLDVASSEEIKALMTEAASKAGARRGAKGGAARESAGPLSFAAADDDEEEEAAESEPATKKPRAQ